jgi:hypothetical protein
MRGHKHPRGSEEGAIRRRKHRERPTPPRWLCDKEGLDEIAKRRCLMILSVLSGEKPVTEAVLEGKISRATYYQLEKKAITAMLWAMLPGSEETGAGSVAAARLVEMEKKLTRMEREKRRSERLLYLTRQVVKPGPMTDGKHRGRPPSTRTGRKPSPDSKKTASPEENASTPTLAGAVGP